MEPWSFIRAAGGSEAEFFEPLAYERWVMHLADESSSSDERLDRRWVEAYRQISRAILDREPRGWSTGHLGPEGTDAHVLVRALVYGQRTARILHGLLEPGWARGTRVFDLGAGTGPASFSAWRHGADAVWSVEPSRPERTWLERARERSGASNWTISAEDAAGIPDRVRSGDWVLFGYSLREITRGSVARAVDLLSACLGRGARILVVEPGTMASFDHLRWVRDRLYRHVRRPCRGAERCPRTGRDWCHFTWKAHLGPRATAILQSAGRRANLVHFGFLELGTPTTLGPALRLLEVRPRGSKRRTLHLCGPGGEVEVDVGPRPRELRAWVDQLEAGALVEVPWAPDPQDRRSLAAPLDVCGTARST